MRIRITYEEIPQLKVETISIIGSFNGYDAGKGILQKQGNIWYTDVDLKEGEHYYKFLINGHLKLNDPKAGLYLPLGEKELWSVISMNEKEEQHYLREPYTLTIEEYTVTDKVSRSPVVGSRKQYHLQTDKQLVVRMKFRDITGLHTVSALWYDGNGQLHEVTENLLYAEEDRKKPVYLWFWIDLGRDKDLYPEGMWSMQLFIDGTYIMEDWFALTDTRAVTMNAVNNYI